MQRRAVVAGFPPRLDLRERFASIGLEVATSSPEELAARVKIEAAKWSKAMTEAGIEPE